MLALQYNKGLSVDDIFHVSVGTGVAQVISDADMVVRAGLI